MYNVVIRNNEENTFRVYHHPLPWCESDFYRWTEGNYSCDCNLRRFWELSLNPNKKYESYPCGYSVRFKAVRIDFWNGQQLDLDDAQ